MKILSVSVERHIDGSRFPLVPLRDRGPHCRTGIFGKYQDAFGMRSLLVFFFALSLTIAWQTYSLASQNRPLAFESTALFSR